MAVTAKSRIYQYLDSLSDKDIKLMTNERLYAAFPDINHTTIRRHKCNYVNNKHRVPVTAVQTVHEHPKDPYPDGRKYCEHPPRKKIHTSPPPKTDSAVAGGLAKPSLSPRLKKLVTIGKQLEGVPSWFAPLIIEELRKEDRLEGDKRVIKRPTEFHQKQNELIDAVINPDVKVIFCPGAQRSGKSTGVMQGLHELSLISTYPQKILLLAGKGGQSGKDGGAKGILRDLLRDPFLEENNKKLLNLNSRTNDTVQWFQGNIMTATDLTVAAIKGGDQNIVWIDELDVAIKKGADKREAVVSAVNTMLAVPNFKLILTANLDKGLYQILAERIKEMGMGKESVKIIEIYKSDCPHLENDGVSENYQIAQVFTEVLLDAGMAKMRLQGEMSYEGDIFDQQSIKDAYAIYETLLNTTFENPDEFWLETEYNVLAIDPSGEGHPWGYFIGGVVNNFFIEIASGELQLGSPQSMGGGRWTPARLNEFVYKMMKQYNVKYVVIESNTGGPGLKIYLQGKGFTKVEYQNFGAEGNYNARTNYLKVVNKILHGRALALKNRSIHPQLTVYDPDERKKTATHVSQKGDVADAFIHFCWKAAGGLKYIPKQTPQLQHEVRIL